MRGLCLHELTLLDSCTRLTLHKVLRYGLGGLWRRCFTCLGVCWVSNALTNAVKHTIGETTLCGSLARNHIRLVTLNHDCAIQACRSSIAFVWLVMIFGSGRQLLGWLRVYVIKHWSFIVSEDYIRLAFVTMDQIKFLESSQIIALAGLHLIDLALAFCHWVSGCFRSHWYHCILFTWTRRSSHVKRIDLTFIERFPLLHSATCHGRILLFLELFESHLRNERGCCVRSTMSGYRITLFNSLHFLSIIRQIWMTAGLRLSASILALIIVYSL